MQAAAAVEEVEKVLARARGRGLPLPGVAEALEAARSRLSADRRRALLQGLLVQHAGLRVPPAAVTAAASVLDSDVGVHTNVHSPSNADSELVKRVEEGVVQQAQQLANFWGAETPTELAAAVRSVVAAEERLSWLNQGAFDWDLSARHWAERKAAWERLEAALVSAVKAKAGVAGEYAEARVEWLVCYIRTLLSKMEAMEAQVLQDTYADADTLSALRKARKILRHSLVTAQHALDKARAAVAAYDGIHEDFDALAHEYASLSEELHARKALLEELRRDQHLS
eukprot:jgi/Chlat1/7025/Chrsp56S06663